MSKAKSGKMKDDANRELKPKLRFPEFRDDGSWQTKTLGKVLPITSCKRVHQSDWSDSGVPFYRAREIVAIQKGEGIEPLLISEELYRENTAISGEIKEGDLLITGVGSIGIPYLVKKEDRFYFKDGNIIWLQNDESELLGIFLYYLYNTRLIQKQIESIAGVGTVGTYTIQNAKNTQVAIPPKKDEQQKIADCLSSLDELIAAHSRKLDALKAHKKGLMQQLFPREGETLPRLRFPEFKDAKPWKPKKLKDIAEVSSGTTPRRSNPEFFEGGTIPWVKTTDLNNSFITETEECVTSLAKVKINPVGSILVAMYGGFKQIGRTGYLTKPAATNQALSVLQVDAKEVLPIYLLFWLNAKVEVWKRIASSSRKDPNITGSDVASFPIQFPELGEQQKIADCVSCIDAAITGQAEKIDGLHSHKKGLMQQLFPQLEGNNR